MNIPFFNRKNTINKPMKGIYGQSFGLWSIGNRRYNDAYLWMVIGKIFSGLRNIKFYADIPEENQNVKELIYFIDTNITLMAWELWTLGFICIDYDIYGKPYFPQIDKIRKDVDGGVIGYPVVIYSDKYVFTKKSDLQILSDNLIFIDRLKNADEYLTTNLGTLGILSSKELPFSDADKDEFYENLRKDFGITGDKKQLLLFNNPIDFKQMRLPVKDLEIPEKIREEMKLIAGYFNVPYDLIPFSGQSTYANQEQAIKLFYSDCISPLAEVILKVLRYMVVHSKPMILVPSEKLTFKIENVPELEDDRNVEIDYKMKLISLIKEMDEIGIDSTEQRKKLKANN